MSLPKVYLAKSNRANPDLVSKVRQLLRSFHVDVVEYTGGGYSHGPLLKCDYLIVIPDLESGKIGERYVNVGKGLFEQVDYFSDEHAYDKIFTITDSDLNVKKLYALQVKDRDDYIDYGNINFKTDIKLSLEDVCEELFGRGRTTDMFELSPKNYFHLLTKKLAR